MIFSSDNSTYIDGMLFVPVTFPYNIPDALLIENLQIQQLVEYCNRKHIQKAFIQGVQNFEFLRDCKSIEHITIELRLPFDAYAALKSAVISYDLSSLQSLPNLKSIDIREDERYGSRAKVLLDLGRIKGLEEFCGDYKFANGLSEAIQLKTLQLSKFKKFDLLELKQLSLLDTVHFSFSNLESLDGVQNFPRLQCLYLSYNRRLHDISDLRHVKKNLRALRIENCPRIQDFTVLYELENLELLELSGKNDLPSLDFINEMPNLKTLIFSVNILDGNLSPCKNLSWAYSERNRKHYNVKDADLPKITYHHGNENIELWRRLE